MARNRFFNTSPISSTLAAKMSRYRRDFGVFYGSPRDSNVLPAQKSSQLREPIILQRL
ncbi:hypothetical protein PROFUN_12222 [Planoprotostelium fungivorum]|uniref:Uncharacterized protein n=1 Tax=Planoprotostelium fungivorum TaxID=1890364 RepID=A0A2P6N866_9EUKA|nr:hypothetical protein PROFUN_12222 [Planoprotostelium fungivorum]